jgi:pantoate--beta-alanine ligase
LAALRGAGDTLALVPTMGALHDGPSGAGRRSRRQAAHVAATIFVNPLQFNDADDLARYPRQEEADLRKLDEAGCDLVWLPTPDQLYPQASPPTCRCAASASGGKASIRPGHFRRGRDRGREAAAGNMA